MYAFLHDNPIFRVDPFGLAGFGDLRMAEERREQGRQLREMMMCIALSHVGSRAFSWNAAYTNFGRRFRNCNKCNLFVFHVAQIAGTHVPEDYHKDWSGDTYPPTAKELGSGSEIPGWETVNSPVPGAIISDGGHTGVVVGDGSTVSASSITQKVENNNWGFRPENKHIVIRIPQP